MSIPYYRFFPGDYARDTRHLSLMQHGVYRLLIDLYMDHGKALRNDLPYLYRWLHAESVEEKNAVEFVLAEFFVLTGNRWGHRRCENEIEWRKTKGESAKQSASKRWQSERNANAMRTQSDGNANQNQNQNQNHKKKKHKTKDAASSMPDVPDWLPTEAWGQFIEHRKALRKPLTENAVRLALAELNTIRALGHDLTQVLNQSIANGWSGIFPLKTKPAATAQSLTWTPSDETE